MANVVAVKEETNLAGVLKSQLTAVGLSFTALFYDTKTGVQRTPQSTTLTFTLNKDGAKAERIRLTSHTTDATTGITTCTIASSGRALPKYGVGSGSSTGFQHEPGDPIGCVTNHEPAAQLINWMEGVVGSGANNLRVGDGAAGNKTIYAENADASKPFLRYDDTSNIWVFSNDGTSSTAIGNGASVYTGGDGITVTASDIDIDLTDTLIFVQTSSGAGDSGKVPRLGGDGKLATGFIPNLTLSWIPAITVTADQINSAIGAFQLTLTALEAIDGTTTPQYVSYGSENMRDVIKIYNTSSEISTAAGSAMRFGSVDALTRIGQSFVYTDALAASIKAGEITILLRTGGAPSDNVTCSVFSDSAGSPGSVITDGTSATVSGSGLTTAYRPQKFTWSTPPTLVSGTTYWLVFSRSGANDAANYYEILSSAGNQYANGSSKEYTASTTSWGTGSYSGNDIQMQFVLNISYGGKICKTDVDHPCRANGIGFVTSSISAAASGDVYYGRHVTYSGLTDGQTYVGSVTAGGLTLSTSSPIAHSVDSTSQIPHIVAGDVIGGKVHMSSYKRAVIIDDKVGAFTAVAATSIDVYIPIGFRADEVILKYTYNDDSAANADGQSFDVRYVGLTKVGGTWVQDGATSSSTGVLVSTGSVTAARLGYGNFPGGGNPAENAVTLQNIYDNAIQVRLTLNATADSVHLVQVEAVKY